MCSTVGRGVGARGENELFERGCVGCCTGSFTYICVYVYMYTYIIKREERKELSALIDMCDFSVFDLETPWVALDQ